MPSTTRYKRGDIVLVSFPFTDLSSSKRRPALVVSPDSFNEAMQDLVLAAITSQGMIRVAIGPIVAIVTGDGECFHAVGAYLKSLAN
jgi:mRNA interferase MazF